MITTAISMLLIAAILIHALSIHPRFRPWWITAERSISISVVLFMVLMLNLGFTLGAHFAAGDTGWICN